MLFLKMLNLAEVVAVLDQAVILILEQGTKCQLQVGCPLMAVSLLY